METARERPVTAQTLEMLKLACGLTDQEIGDLAGMARSTVRTKRQDRELTVSESLALAEGFGVPVELFYMPADQAKHWIFDRWDMLRLSAQTEYFGTSICPGQLRFELEDVSLCHVNNTARLN